jgi:serine/threonine protein kinase
MGVERFLREARTIAGLNHRNIVMVHDIGKDGLGHYIVMEYIDGTVLNLYIRKKGKLSLEESLEILQGIGSGLSHAHKKDIVHRDIKPGNIIIDSENIPKILDFGLARMGIYSQLSISGYGMGTMDYASPEQKRHLLSGSNAIRDAHRRNPPNCTLRSSASRNRSHCTQVHGRKSRKAIFFRRRNLARLRKNPKTRQPKKTSPSRRIPGRNLPPV